MNQDNFSQILKLLKKTGGRYIIVENGRPAFIIQTWEDFRKLISKGANIFSEEETINKVNEEIALWREAQSKKKILDEFGTAPDVSPEEDFDYLRDEELSTDVDY